ncbi:THAP-type domain-containing protein, partial [Aphis craccivora]
SGKQFTYPKEIREFALTLQYYSPRAYLYVRKSFSNILPHPRTLRWWYTVVDGKPGFTLEALEAIKQKVAAGHVYCNLTVDVMCVKRHLETDTHQNVYGHVNMGTNVVYDSDEIPLAKNALVFLVVGMNGYWEVPVGYFLIDGLTGIERGKLLAKAIDLITETGANLHSVTFDGASVNLSMCTSLGADLNTKTPYIQNPNTLEKILVFHDQAHMIKLIRNTFGDKKILKNGDGKCIEWKFIEKLFEKEQKVGLKLATKLTSRHVMYQNEKMNVRLASQVLSKSVSDALLYLKKEDPNFEGCEATAEFCSMVNNAFDITNSRKLYSKKPYNSAISTKTFDQYKTFTNEFTNYIENLLSMVQLN